MFFLLEAALVLDCLLLLICLLFRLLLLLLSPILLWQFSVYHLSLSPSHQSSHFECFTNLKQLILQSPCLLFQCFLDFQHFLLCIVNFFFLPPALPFSLSLALSGLPTSLYVFKFLLCFVHFCFSPLSVIFSFVLNPQLIQLFFVGCCEFSEFVTLFSSRLLVGLLACRL